MKIRKEVKMKKVKPIINGKDYRDQGDLGEAIAISYFTKRGWKVSIPFSGCRYDLIVDDGSKLYLVQVKTCFKRSLGNHRGGYLVYLKTRTSEKGKLKITFLDDRIDFLFIYLGDGSMFLIPKADIPNRQKCLYFPGNTNKSGRWTGYKI